MPNVDRFTQNRNYPIPHPDNDARPDTARIADALGRIDADVASLVHGLANVDIPDMPGAFTVRSVQMAGPTYPAGWGFLNGNVPVLAHGDLDDVDSIVIADVQYSGTDFATATTDLDISDDLDRVEPGFIFRVEPEPANGQVVYFRVSALGLRTGTKGDPAAFVTYAGEVVGYTRTLPQNNVNSFWGLFVSPHRVTVEARDVANPGELDSGVVTELDADTFLLVKDGVALGRVPIRSLRNLLNYWRTADTPLVGYEFRSSNTDSAGRVIVSPSGFRINPLDGDEAVASAVSAEGARIRLEHDSSNWLEIVLGPASMSGFHSIVDISRESDGGLAQGDTVNVLVRGSVVRNQDVQQSIDGGPSRLVVPSLRLLIASLFTPPYYAEPGQVSHQGNVVTVNPNPALPGLLRGARIEFVAESGNSGAVQINVSGTGNRSLRRADGSLMESGAFSAGRLIAAIFDGANWISNIQGNLSEYARLNGATFTGRTRGQTRPDGDNGTDFATTAFVQSALPSIVRVDNEEAYQAVNPKVAGTWYWWPV